MADVTALIVLMNLHNSIQNVQRSSKEEYIREFDCSHRSLTLQFVTSIAQHPTPQMNYERVIPKLAFINPNNAFTS